MMVDATTRALVWRRAEGRCEYCGVHQGDFDFFVFHVEHIIPRQHGGSDAPDNLCLACPACNAAKGPNVAGLLDGKIVPLFHPRRQVWKRHFHWRNGFVISRTRAGKVTVQVLNMNDPARVMVRQNLCAEGRYPPPDGR